jgi:hypothetical protein
MQDNRTSSRYEALTSKPSVSMEIILAEENERARFELSDERC